MDLQVAYSFIYFKTEEEEGVSRCECRDEDVSISPLVSVGRNCRRRVDIGSPSLPETRKTRGAT